MRALTPAAVLALAVIAGSAMDATIKHLAQTNHILLVTLGRYAFGALFSLGLWLRAGTPRITAEMLRAHGGRGAIIAASGSLFFWGLSVLPLAEVVTLSFVGALLIPFAARWMIGERLRLPNVAAALVGFAGVVVAAQGAPSAAQAPDHALGVVAVLIASALFAIAMVLLRTRAQSDGPIIVGLLASAMPALFLVVPAIAVAPPPLWSDGPIFLLMGVFAATFMYLIASAYAGAETQLLAPIHYSELLWASLIGFVVFHEAPRPQIYLGAAIIIGACLYSAYAERRLTTR